MLIRLLKLCLLLLSFGIVTLALTQLMSVKLLSLKQTTQPMSPLVAQSSLSTTPLSVLDTRFTNRALTLDDYHFDASQALPQSNHTLSLVQWLPNAPDQLLTVQSDPSNTAYQQIVSFDLQAAHRRVYGRIGPIDPVVTWLASTKKVAFIGYEGKAKFLQISGVDVSQVITPLIWGGRVMGDVRALAGVGNGLLVLEAGKGEARFFDAQGNEHATLPLALHRYGINLRGDWLQMIASPDGKRVAIFDPGGLILVTMASGAITPIDLGEENTEISFGNRWAFESKWSPDGKQLAVIAVTGEPIFQQAWLMTIDGTTGQRQTVALPVNRLFDLAWAANSRQLLVRGGGQADAAAQFFLIDVQTKSDKVIEQFADSVAGGTGDSLLWSLDGATVVYRCMLGEEGSKQATTSQLCRNQVIVEK